MLLDSSSLLGNNDNTPHCIECGLNSDRCALRFGLTGHGCCGRCSHHATSWRAGFVEARLASSPLDTGSGGAAR